MNASLRLVRWLTLFFHSLLSLFLYLFFQQALCYNVDNVQSGQLHLQRLVYPIPTASRFPVPVDSHPKLLLVYRYSSSHSVNSTS